MKYILFAAFALLLANCGVVQENDQLKIELDSLRQLQQTETKLKEELAGKLEQVNTLLDTIESTDAQITLRLERGTSYDDYSSRLSRINDYMKQTRARLEEMEGALAKANSKNSVYINTISRLKKTLEEKETKIAELNQQVDKYKSENEALIKTVDLQTREIADRDNEIRIKREELAAIEKKVEDMLAQAKKAEADAYFARAETTEELAQRTKLAPKKKKETLEEAYQLYKKAFEAGRTDAYARMEQLKSKM